MNLPRVRRAIFFLTALMFIGYTVPAFSQQPDVIALQTPDPAAPPQEAETELAPVNGDPSVQQVLGAIEALGSDQPIDGVTALAILAIGSFFVDRVSTALLKLLSLSAFWRKQFPDPATMPSDADPKQRSAARTRLIVVYYIFSALVAIGLVGYFGHVKLFSALGFAEMDPMLDAALTGLMMVVGAERVAQWLNLPGSPGVTPADPQPITIVGDLLFKEASRMLDEAVGNQPGETEAENSN